MNSKGRGRRRFLKEGAALAGLAMGTVRSVSGQTPAMEVSAAPAKTRREYGERSPFENSVRLLGQWGPRTPLQESVGIITPSSLHFMAAHGYDPPNIDPQKHRLLIHGLVDRPLIFTLEDLKRLPSVTRIHFIECGGNTNGEDGKGKTVQETHGWTSCAEWTGVLLSVLLQEAGLKKEAKWLVAEGSEGGKHTKSIPLEKATQDCLVVYGQNGEALRPEQGYPLRLVVPGWMGINQVKWLRRIKVVDQGYMTKWEASGYANMMRDGKARSQYEMGLKSVITRPSGGQRLPGRGYYEITGLAWSGWGAIRRVEVSTDGGRTWKDAQLQQPVHTKAHTRFRTDWNWNGEEAVLQSRCTDDQGGVQPTFAELEKIRLDSGRAGLAMNAIFSWKVTREGNVQNGMV
jgi:sulfane dehydrogenase subunit SoxC